MVLVLDNPNPVLTNPIPNPDSNDNPKNNSKNNSGELTDKYRC